jgi:chemotaxis family two-component system response regulator Rcp1
MTIRNKTGGMVSAPARPYSILVAEDNESDVFLFERALKRQRLGFELIHLRDGDEALAFIRKEGRYADMPRPDLILVDLNLPKINGEEIIRQIRTSRHLDGVSACVWSSSDALREQASLNRLGVDEFIFKPSGLEQFMQIGKTIKDLLSRGLATAAPAPAFT